MNRLQELFQNKKENILTLYFTAGFPELNDTGRIIKAIEDSGADIIEVGMPFSDPLADGPTIQLSGLRALRNGMNLKTMFKQLKEVRKESKIPILLMGYLNPIWKFGVESFLQQCEECGVDGLILPDIPLDEYEKDYDALYKKHGLSNVFLITPQTPEERIRKIDALCTGFIYMVSSASTTGANKSSTDTKQLDYYNRIKSMNLKSPTQIGFNIKDKNSFQTACKYANGAIIGSAFIKALEKDGALEDHTKAFIESIKEK